MSSAQIIKRSDKVSVRLEHDLSCKLSEAASITKRSKSEVLRDAIEREISRSFEVVSSQAKPGQAGTP